MDALNLKDKILDLLDQASREEQAFLATLSDEERAEKGAPDHWSARDILTHNAVWKERFVENLEAASKGKPNTAFDDMDKSNAEIFEEHRYDTWKEVVERSKLAAIILIQRIRALEVDDFNRTQFLSWQRGRPLWRLIIINGFYHPIDHLARYYLEHGSEHGGKSYATKILEEATGLLRELDDDPGWLGIVAYNLACHYAQASEKEKASRILEDALRLAPELLDWSKQDPDLVSIRE